MDNKIIHNSQSTELILQNQKTKNELDDSCCEINDSDQSSQRIAKFVIGILKPGQKRIGLIAANKNKITICGILGIKSPKK